jgi:hypothetical protein
MKCGHKKRFFVLGSSFFVSEEGRGL